MPSLKDVTPKPSQPLTESQAPTATPATPATPEPIPTEAKSDEGGDFVSGRKPKSATSQNVKQYIQAGGPIQYNVCPDVVSSKMHWTAENFSLVPYNKDWRNQIELRVREIVDNEDPLNPYSSSDIQIMLTYFYGIRSVDLRTVDAALEVCRIADAASRKNTYWTQIKQQADKNEVAMLKDTEKTDEELHNLPQTQYDQLAQWENLYTILGHVVNAKITTFEVGTVEERMPYGCNKQAAAQTALNLGAREGFLSKRGHQYTIREKGKAFINHQTSG